jgi:hypothetical protein
MSGDVSRCRRGRPAGLAFTELVATACIQKCRLSIALNAEAAAAFGPAGTNHSTPTTRSHANQETMRAFTADNRRLISALHNQTFGKNWRMRPDRRK